jgi:hypothetical protein
MDFFNCSLSSHSIQLKLQVTLLETNITHISNNIT